MRLPAEINSEEWCAGATHLCLEFWRGVVFMGRYKLQLAKIRKVLAGQVQGLNNTIFAQCDYYVDC